MSDIETVREALRGYRLWHLRVDPTPEGDERYLYDQSSLALAALERIQDNIDGLAGDLNHYQERADALVDALLPFVAAGGLLEQKLGTGWGGWLDFKGTDISLEREAFDNARDAQRWWPIASKRRSE